jgi:hypothetical protein
VEYQENEVSELLALELPIKKKKDLDHVTCFKCKQKVHYSNQCPEKSISMIAVKKGDTIIVQCYNCNELGHYTNKCPKPK